MTKSKYEVPTHSRKLLTVFCLMSVSIPFGVTCGYNVLLPLSAFINWVISYSLVCILTTLNVIFSVMVFNVTMVTDRMTVLMNK